MASDFRGDPASALLEVLDPEQELHLSRTLSGRGLRPFAGAVCGHGNVMHTVPPALQDRMEVLRLQGYTEQEKLEIARNIW